MPATSFSRARDELYLRCRGGILIFSLPGPSAIYFGARTPKSQTRNADGSPVFRTVMDVQLKPRLNLDSLPAPRTGRRDRPARRNVARQRRRRAAALPDDGAEDVRRRRRRSGNVWCGLDAAFPITGAAFFERRSPLSAFVAEPPFQLARAASLPRSRILANRQCAA